MKKLVDELATYFLANGYEWKFDYGMAIPNEDDLERAIVKVKEILENDPSDNVQLEIGRMLFKKRDGFIDVFVYMGNLEDK
ncbi:hypothetical protein PP459_gp106 [Streptomyces phage Wakanda]|uniref:Uncharacterized protein n=2 Tax=Wakandavirus TaxID=3044854 RepID=A0A6G8R3C5_9CAUD|nr:hypothetical protein PP459_gp106 [Streptomyces phage Wakanda]YP_010652448.1 hypothetical protein PP460_gp110 [Streptomyces phage Muntaha]QIN94127.1 hypothetical protein SEA_WAKANDA_165 [Streptomyces phage Wakanda]QIN94692.1 hypothetical protein SEA_MUNTAHA_167 [Streptomyces phage Muntaha]